MLKDSNYHNKAAIALLKIAPNKLEKTFIKALKDPDSEYRSY
jgi:hypothetical protein